ncbi:MAG: translocation/assembly module TamB domain-containing protein [Cyclobacteriaceae bacterium]|nr:translocation/assembly module TamB domain-containing protein [Cyclobacteriaceae bacterium HetDA_MAG_MS6]
MMAKIGKRLVKISMWAAVSFMCLSLLISLAIQIPSVQHILVKKVVAIVQNHCNHRISIENVGISWLDEADFGDVEIYDFRDSLLFRSDVVEVDFSLFTLLFGKDLAVDRLMFRNSRLSLVKYDETHSLNVIEFINSLKSANAEGKKKLKVGHIEFASLQFSMNDLRKAPGSTDRMDFSHFAFDLSSIEVENLGVWEDTVLFDVHTLYGKEVNDLLIIEQFSSEVSFTRKHLVFGDLFVKTPYSQVEDFVAFTFNEPANLGYLLDSVQLDFSLNNSRISMMDLSVFSAVPRKDTAMMLSAQIKGSIPRLNISRASLQYGSSHFLGSIYLAGLPKISDTFVDLSISEAELSGEDLQPLLPILPESVVPGDVQFSGSLLGFVRDFVAKGTFQTRFGTIYSDLNLKVPGDLQNAIYRGALNVSNFNFGQLLGDTTYLDRINFSGSIDGKGLSKSRANFFLNADMTDTRINGYEYDKIHVTGQFSSNFFDGNFKIDDDNLQASAVAKMDLNPQNQVIKAEINIDTLNVDEIYLFSQDLGISTQVSLDVKGFHLDSTRGKVEFNNTSIRSDDYSTGLETFTVIKENTLGGALMTVEGPGISGEVTGDFLPTQLGKDLYRLLLDYQGYFTSDVKQVGFESDSIMTYGAKLTLETGDMSPYFGLLDLPVSVSANGLIEANFHQGKDDNLSFYAAYDTVRYGRRTFYDNTVDISASKDVDSLGVLALILISSERQDWDAVPYTTDFLCESLWFNNQIDVSLNFEQPESQGSAHVNGEIQLLQDSIKMHVLPSRILALNKEWVFSRGNQILLHNDKLLVDQLEIYHQDQAIKLSGVISDSLPTSMGVSFNAFDLQNLATLFPKRLSGTLDGAGRFTRNGKNDPLHFNSNIRIDDMHFENLLVGDFAGRSSWNTAASGLDFNFKIRREQIETIDVLGLFKPLEQEEQLEIDVDFYQANLQLLEPIFSQSLSGIGGEATGKIKVTGKVTDPKINGEGQIKSGAFTINYLNTDYKVNGGIEFDDRTISFEDVELTDRLGNKASLTGALSHVGFRSIETNVQLDAERFEMLNNTAEQSSTIYGDAYATGTVDISGPLEDLLIKATLVSEKGTRIYLPISESGEVERKEYISFVSFDEPELTTEKEEVPRLSGISLDFDIAVTPDAYAELIFDPRTGDIIRGRGRGNIQLTMDSNGELTLFGGLEVTEGAYNFTLANLGINKEFNIKPGGVISWFGDPYAGVVQLEAVYRQLASPAEWYGTETAGVQKSPVLVVLGLTESMFAPTIAFSIELENESVIQSTAGDWSSMLATINSDDQELKRQVFSLLMLRKFSRKSSFVVGGDNLGSSLSEFFSNQLSYWVNQVDDNLEVDFDLASFNQDAFNTFQLRLSYSFLDGRLRVSRDGGFANAQNPEDRNAINNVLGDWSVEYFLTQDGRLRAKMFSRVDRNTIAGSTGTTTSLEAENETGVSLQYVRSFDDFKELLGKSRKDALSQ